jgi:hypothetical protein
LFRQRRSWKYCDFGTGRGKTRVCKAKITTPGEEELLKMLRKVISGGKTGADRAGLDFAIETDLEHEGYVPRGRKAENGRIDDRYNLF